MAKIWNSPLRCKACFEPAAHAVPERFGAPAVVRQADYGVGPPMRMVGLMIAAFGLVLLIFGLTAEDAPFERVSYAVTGHYGDATLWYLVSGAGAVVAGALLAAFGPRRM